MLILPPFSLIIPTSPIPGQTVGQQGADSLEAPIPIRFKGRWKATDRAQIASTLQTAEERMPDVLRERLRSAWVATTKGTGRDRYVVLHRPGLKEAYTGRSILEVIERIHQRLLQPKGVDDDGDA